MSSLVEKYVIALDFGYPANPRAKSSITDLAELVYREWAEDSQTMVLAQDFIYDSLYRMHFPEERLLEVGSGQSTSVGLENGGSYHMLKRASEMLEPLGARPFDWVPTKMLPQERRPPIQATVVAHALHVKRVVKQGRLFGLELTPAQNLPTKLYPAAAQWWCRNKYGWHFREFIGYLPLKLAGQL